MWGTIFKPESLLPLAVLMGAVWLSFRSGGFKGGKESNEILRGLNNDLKEELKNRQEKHEHELAAQRDLYEEKLKALQAQIETLNTQVTSLKQANEVYQNTVTGKETLAQIIEVLAPVPALFAPGGILEGFKTSDALIIKNQEKDRLEILRNITELKGMIGEKRNLEKTTT